MARFIVLFIPSESARAYNMISYFNMHFQSLYSWCLNTFSLFSWLVIYLPLNSPCKSISSIVKTCLSVLFNLCVPAYVDMSIKRKVIENISWSSYISLLLAFQKDVCTRKSLGQWNRRHCSLPKSKCGHEALRTASATSGLLYNFFMISSCLLRNIWFYLVYWKIHFLNLILFLKIMGNFIYKSLSLVSILLYYMKISKTTSKKSEFQLRPLFRCP